MELREARRRPRPNPSVTVRTVRYAPNSAIRSNRVWRCHPGHRLYPFFAGQGQAETITIAEATGDTVVHARED